MTDASTRVLADRIGAIIERVKILAEERDVCRDETDALKSRLETNDREHARLRGVLADAVRELRQE